jgi:hypothetical protein
VATLDGVIHLAHPRPQDTRVMTETFSLSGVMTAKNPISWITEAKTLLRSGGPGAHHRSRYSIWAKFVDQVVPSAAALKDAAAAAKDKVPPTSNGFGTLAEAGWSVQHPIAGVRNHAAGGLAMARCGSRLMLLSQPQAGGPLFLSVGDYGEGKPARAVKRKAMKRKTITRKHSRKR